MISGLELDFLDKNLEVFREYDISSYISNAKSILTESQNPIDISDKFSFYTDTIDKAIQSIDNEKIDSNEIKDFIDKFYNMSRVDTSVVTMRKITQGDVGAIKPQYLQEYIKSVANSINTIINGGGTVNDIVKYQDPNLTVNIKRQIVRTSLPYNADVKALMKINNDEDINVTEDYIKSTVLDYVIKYPALKKVTITEANAVSNAINESAEYMKAMVNTINNLKVSDELDANTLAKLNKVSYNAIRGILDIISFVTYMQVRKLRNLNSNIISCEQVKNDIANLYNEDNVIEMTQFDDEIIPQDAASLGEALISGDSSAYSELANNIYDFHNSFKPGIRNEIELDDDDIMNSSLSNERDQEPFDSGIYNDIRKAYKEISDGLDIISSKSDDYLMVFDDIIEEAGFSIELQNRFKEIIDTIPNLPEYTSAIDVMQNGVPNNGVYNSILAEVKQYDEIMSRIALAIKSDYIKILGLEKRFSQNINGEFKNAESVNELKIFMSTLLEQFRVMTTQVAGNLMIRLRKLGILLTDIESRIDSNAKEMDLNTTPLEVGSDIDFSECVLEDDYFESVTEEMFRNLQLAYYVEKANTLRGVNVYFTEADNQPTVNNGGDNANANTSGSKPVVNDPNGKDTSSINLSNIAAKLDQVLRTLIDKFMNMIGKDGKRNMKWIGENKQELETRSYSNTSVQIIPYKNHAAQLADFDAIIGKVNGLSNAIAGLKQANDVYTYLFGGFQGFSIQDQSNKGELRDKLNYFAETGNCNQPQRATYANTELANYVKNTMIPACETFYSQDSMALKAKATDLKNAFTKVSGSFNPNGNNATQTPPPTNTNVQQPAANNQQATNQQATNENASADDLYRPLSLDDYASMYLEADANNANANGNTTGEESTSSKLNIVKKGIELFIAAEFTAARRRTNDYLTTLSALTPRPAKNQAQVNAGEGNGVDQGNNQQNQNQPQQTASNINMQPPV